MNRKYFIVIFALILAFGMGYVISMRGNNDSPIQENTADTSEPEANSRSLDLSGTQLTNLPDSVLNQTDITFLNLSNNQLTGLPVGIARLTNLEVLNIENNRLESFPDEIAQLGNLRQILANNNRMKTVSPGLKVMTWLEVLDISGNNIPSDEIAELKAELLDTQIKN